MKTYILLTDKVWHDDLFAHLLKNDSAKWVRIDKKEMFTVERLKTINPDKIFIPHWSHIIESEIYSNYECVVFHMTDLPFGRGGSPLQNLIQLGFKNTKISAIRVEAGLDEGPIYLKKDLSLEGTALQIFERAAAIIQDMINEILEHNPIPMAQEGEITKFRRRKPAQSEISKLKELNELYDQIRMLDCDGYPSAYFETDNFKIEINNADLKNNNELTANVRITKK